MKILSCLIKIPVIIASCILISCGGHRTNGPSAVDVEALREVERISLGTDDIFPTSMTVVNGNVVFSLMRTENNFLVVPTESPQRAFQAGPKGRGPMDFLNVDPYSIKAEGDGFIVADMTGLKKCHLVDKGIEVNSLSFVTSKCLPLNGFSQVSGGYVNMLASRDKEFAVFDSQGNLKESMSPYPDWSKDTDTEKTFLYLKMWAPNLDGDKLAVFYSHFDKFRIINLSGKVLFEVDTDLGDSMEAENDLERICYRSNPQVASQFIAALHRNKDGAEVQIWDWKAQLHKRYAIPGNVTQFAIDWDAGKLWWFDSTSRTSLFGAEIII